jgi:hypothetical protein
MRGDHGLQPWRVGLVAGLTLIWSHHIPSLSHTAVGAAAFSHPGKLPYTTRLSDGGLLPAATFRRDGRRIGLATW